MAITELNIERKRGDTKRMTFIFKDSSGAVIDISGWTDFLFTITSDKKPSDNSTQVEQITGVLSTDGTDGRVHFIPAGTLDAAKYYYDVQAIDSNSEKTTIVEGEYLLTQDRTKD